MKKTKLTEEEKEIVKLRLDLLQLNHKYDALFEKSISVMRKVKETLKGLGLKSNEIDDFLKPFELAVVSGSVLPDKEIWNWNDVIKDVIINKDKDKPNSIGTALNYLAENYEVPNKIKTGKTDR